jgi:hypothetical protein
MNGVAANRMGRSGVGARRQVLAALPLLLCLLATGAIPRDEVPQAASSSFASDALAQRIEPAQLELSALSLPRLDSVDGSSQTSRIALTWLPPQQPALGLAMGMSLGMTNRSASPSSVGAPSLRSTPAIDLGLQWRYTMDRQYRIDFTAWHRVAAVDAIDLVQSREPRYGARLEMGLGSLPKSGFVADRGFLGLQLDGGARVTVRRNAGKPMIYYRSTF